MSDPPIKLSLYNFIDEFASQVRSGDVGEDDDLEDDSEIIVFCEAFFDQFFAHLGHSIRGFNERSKRDAGELIEKLRADKCSDSASLRAVLALYEAFCDMYVDVLGTRYGSGSITFERFLGDYMTRFFARTYEWALGSNHSALVARISSARDVYDAALRDMGW